MYCKCGIRMYIYINTICIFGGSCREIYRTNMNQLYAPLLFG